ncbi:hypothetical protein KUTeg_010754 [Tegillarca granosa]|uniref:Solute carrier family 23 member 2 n=1 Tax=Tegillarca granosa TaxID=220873 RepID=A0ABQ9F239_TEGGR|nr:hypothetical protein KUTeg_010754 [Tegillarca granosa]
MSMGGVLSVVIIISDLVCAEDDDPIRSQLFTTSLFMVGVGTIVNTAFGIRLPVFQGPSSTFLVPLLALRSTGEWTCPSKTYPGNNMTANYSEIARERQILQYSRLSELQGSLMLSSLFEVITGATGLIGILMRYIGPITMSFYIPDDALCDVLGSYTDTITEVLLSLALSWVLCFILTVTGVLSNDPASSDYKARTDTRLRIIEETPWFYFPYPGQFGIPRFNPAVFVGFLVAVVNSAFESIGDYYATAKACYIPPPPRIMSVISGALGAGHATTTYSNHVAIISLTKIASRSVLVTAGVIAVVVSLLSKIGAVFTIIPDPALTGSAFVSLGLVTSLGISSLQKVDLNSSRNLAVIGVSIYAGVVFPEWVKQYPSEISLGKYANVIFCLKNYKMFILSK